MSRFINNFTFDSNLNNQQKKAKPTTKNKSSKKEQKISAKIPSIAEDILQLKHRREDRNQRLEDDKLHKKNFIKNQNFFPKVDDDFNFLI